MDTFWSESFWLPKNVTWREFYQIKHPGQLKPTVQHLLYIIPCAICVFFARYIVEKCIFRQIGKRLGLQDLTCVVQKNDKLEAVYKVEKKPSEQTIKNLSVKLQLSPKYISNWLRKRRNRDKFSVLTKFAESGWRCVFYASTCVYGFYALWSKSYFWETLDCWRGWPHQHVSNDIFWYYMIELGYYWAALISVFWDVKRKDFKEMVLHHVVTIWLMMFSWTNNFIRIGSLVLLVHDIVDPWLEAAKMLKYIGWDIICNVLFVCFLLLWFCTRLTIYPFRVIYSSYFESLEVINSFPSHSFFNVALCILQVLHCIWFYYILRIAYKGLFHGTMDKDSRSESDQSEDSGPDSNGAKKSQ